MTKIAAQKRFELGRLEARLPQTDFDMAWRNKVRGADDKQDLILDTSDREFNIYLFYITNKIILLFCFSLLSQTLQVHGNLRMCKDANLNG